MLTQIDFAIITKLDTASGVPSQRSALLQDQPEQVVFAMAVLVINTVGSYIYIIIPYLANFVEILVEELTVTDSVPDFCGSPLGARGSPER